jgi:hypothetical protein
MWPSLLSHGIDCIPTYSPFQSGLKLVDATLYRQLVGSLLYLTHTYLDISFVVGLVSQHFQAPHESHWKATKMIRLYV